MVGHHSSTTNRHLNGALVPLGRYLCSHCRLCLEIPIIGWDGGTFHWVKIPIQWQWDKLFRKYNENLEINPGNCNKSNIKDYEFLIPIRSVDTDRTLSIVREDWHNDLLDTSTLLVEQCFNMVGLHPRTANRQLTGVWAGALPGRYFLHCTVRLWLVVPLWK